MIGKNIRYPARYTGGNIGSLNNMDGLGLRIEIQPLFPPCIPIEKSIRCLSNPMYSYI
jgi:hypothetical protein